MSVRRIVLLLVIPWASACISGGSTGIFAGSGADGGVVGGPSGGGSTMGGGGTSDGGAAPGGGATPDGGSTGGGGTTNSLTLFECSVPVSQLPGSSDFRMTFDQSFRYLTGNGIPNHAVGPFPNRGNPNTIRVQSYSYRTALNPAGAGATLGLSPFGFAINGVVFDPGAAEFWNNDRSSGWQYEALSGAVPLGLDCNHAHVQPTGAYHYHGMPTGLLATIGTGERMYHVGYAADGFPIYARYGYSDPEDTGSPVRVLRSSYRVRQGTRPSGPGGSYDGTFVQDYEYVAGLGDLDECNGRTGETSEHGRTYHYYLTDTFPFIPRCFKSAPDTSFVRRGP